MHWPRLQQPCPQLPGPQVPASPPLPPSAAPVHLPFTHDAPALHGTHFPPLVPQFDAVVPGWHLPVESAQPPVHDVPWHVPLALQVWLLVHVAHATPLIPHAEFEKPGS